MTALNAFALLLHSQDAVAIARCRIPAGTQLEGPYGPLVVQQEIAEGHKLALRPLAAGAEVRRYGARIGQTRCAVRAGEWVHSHNLEVGPMEGAYTWQVVPPAPREPTSETFMGFARAGGPRVPPRVGTRNFIAVIAASTCSAHVVQCITRAFTPERLAAAPNVQGVVPLVHHSGCGQALDGLGLVYLRRTLQNVSQNPNVGAAVLVGLGCEVNQIDGCLADLPQPVGGLVIQESGGFRKTVEAGIRAVEDLLPQVNAVCRSVQPVSALNLALQCGGSDGWSGVTANPLVGRVVDRLVRQGGTAVLSETPEIFGAEALLTGRVQNAAVGQKLVDLFNAWREEGARLGFSVDNNPTPGNKAGGLTTIYEKSLGAVAKGGSTPLAAVYAYAEQVTAPGLVFMDTPGYDPVSVTGQLAGGCNLILFTTGRGSVYASPLAPCIKIASHTGLFERLPEDMDFNAGCLLEGEDAELAAERLWQQTLAAASGQLTCSETYGQPECEFVPWQPGATL